MPNLVEMLEKLSVINHNHYQNFLQIVETYDGLAMEAETRQRVYETWYLALKPTKRKKHHRERLAEYEHTADQLRAEVDTLRITMQLMLCGEIDFGDADKIEPEVWPVSPKS